MVPGSLDLGLEQEREAFIKFYNTKISRYMLCPGP